MRRRIQYWKQYLQDKTRRRLRRRISIFLLCIFLAFSFWMLNILGKSYRFELHSYLIFDNIPADKALSIQQARSVAFAVEGTGWNFVKSRLRLMSDTLHIDLRKYQNKDEIDLTKSLIDFESQWKGELKIMDVFPSKIYYNYEKKRIRKVAVNPVLKLSYINTYDLSGKITWYPDSIYISGPADQISKIKSINTVPLILNGLDASTQVNVQIDKNKYPNVVFSSLHTKITIPVEQFTEAEIQVPIQFREIIGAAEVMTFPSECRITYKVALSDYNSVLSQSFKVIAEKNPLLSERMILKLISSPENVKHITLHPETVEYLMIKK